MTFNKESFYRTNPIFCREKIGLTVGGELKTASFLMHTHIERVKNPMEQFQSMHCATMLCSHAAEILLKHKIEIDPTLEISRDILIEQFKYKDRHDLSKLFKRLSDKSRNEIESQFKSCCSDIDIRTEKWDNANNVFKATEHVFEKIRYITETNPDSKPIYVNLSALYVVTYSLFQTIPVEENYRFPLYPQNYGKTSRQIRRKEERKRKDKTEIENKQGAKQPDFLPEAHINCLQFFYKPPDWITLPIQVETP